MSVIGHSPLAGASGAAGGDSGPLHVDDVFSTFVYEGNGSTQSIDNGIDLSGEGGLVWIKRRDSSANHRLGDTERGTTKYLISNQNIAETTNTNIITSYNNNGFDLSTHTQVNGASGTYASWTFRKAPGFFDVVTYTGTGSAQNISHSLGSVPGMIMIHCRDGSHDWEVYHRSTGATKSLHLNKTDGQATDSTVWNNTTPTSSVFTVGTSSNVNQNGHGYVAYVFAHDEQSFGTDSDEAIIKCGSYTTNSSGVIPDVNLGFEPQWLLIKKVSGQYGNTGNWYLYDSMRGMPVGGNEETLYPNLPNAALTGANTVELTSTGFTSGPDYLASGTDTFIYIAIRRPHKPPTAGTEVFDIDTAVGNTAAQSFIETGFPVDLSLTRPLSSGLSFFFFDRLRGGSDNFYNYLQSASTAAETSATGYAYDFVYSTGIKQTLLGPGGSTQLFYNLRRAPGFFDAVAYTGTGSARTVSHNLGVAPELMIVKRRSDTGHWYVYDATLGNTYVNLLSAYSQSYTSSEWNNTSPTSSVFTVGSSAVNGSGSTFIAYLFASLDGISKVGSYTGTGSNIDVNCNFTAGARFVLIKRTDSTGDWYVWDTARGIVSGNDPYLLFNSTAAEVTNTDYVDPLNAGFTVTSSAPAALNASGGTYLFLAIA